eukprot:m.297011 g.297011  ORF g.297011 m.297011 type:complete len:306 (+) comp16395_c3_seq14:3100-4017(+)
MDEYPDDPNIRDCLVRRGAKGFGFNIKGTTQLGGTMMAIGGVLYPPLQYVSAVETEGAAYEGGIRLWDRILEVNGTCVMGANHQKVVECVLKGGDNLNLKIVRVTQDEADRLRLIEEGGDPNKRGGGKIKVDGWEEVDEAKPYTVYHIKSPSGEVLCKKRYSEFNTLHKMLQQRFKIFTLPALPPKKLNGMLKSQLSPKETEQRCQKLNTYMQELFRVEEIENSEIMKNFIPSSVEANDATSPQKDSQKEETAEDVQKEGEEKEVSDEDEEDDDGLSVSKKDKKPLFSDIKLDDEDEEGGEEKSL